MVRSGAPDGCLPVEMLGAVACATPAVTSAMPIKACPPMVELPPAAAPESGGGWV